MKRDLTIKQWTKKCQFIQDKYKAPGVLATISYRLYPTGTMRLEYAVSLWEASNSATFTSGDYNAALLELDKFMSDLTATKSKCQCCGQVI